MARSKLPEWMALVPGYHAYFSFSRNTSGYSGVVSSAALQDSGHGRQGQGCWLTAEYVWAL